MLERFRMRRTETGPEDASSGGLSSGIVAILCLIPIASAIAYGAVDTWAIAFLSLASALTVLLWLAEAWKSRELRISTDPMLLPLVALIVLGCIQLLPLGGSPVEPGLLSVPASRALSLDPYATRFFVAHLVLLAVFFAAALTFIDTRKRSQRLLALLMAFGALIAFFGILQKLADPEGIYGLRPAPQAIPFGPYMNQHHFASLMVMLSGPVFGLLFAGKLKKEIRPLVIIAGVMMAIAVVFTGSRGGMLSYIGMIGFSGLAGYLYRDRANAADGGAAAPARRLATIGGGFALVVIVLGVVAYLGAGENLLRGLGLTEGGADVTSGRSHYWQVAAQIFFANPVIGAGMDAFGVAFTRFDTQSGFFRVEQAHNDYLQMLADGGIAGFLLIGWFIYLLLSKGMSRIANAAAGWDRGAAIGCLAGAIGILIHSFFDFPLRTSANSYFFLMLVVLATRRYAAVVDTNSMRANSTH
jgi:O-antigen ligase